jgi:hypothetical protein
MAAIADLSDLVNRATGGNSGTPQNLFWHKQARIAGAAPAAPIAGRPASLWLYDGQPSAGVAPTTVAAPDNTTNGALKQASPGGGRQQWLTQFWATGLVAGTLVMYDRLLHIGSLNGTTSPGAQTVGGTITRNTGGIGNFIMAEIYSIVGTTGTTITASYTNTTPTAGRTTTAVVFGGTGFREVTRAIIMPLQAGDTGVTAVASTTLAASTTTAGNFGITVGKPIAYAGVGSPGTAGWRDFATGLPGLPEIESGACLSFLWFPATTTAPELMGGASFVEA